ncbi:MAG: hypothetical protein WBO73_00540 [Gammaproteobacteria bacterium]|jgi:hypothetical protein
MNKSVTIVAFAMHNEISTTSLIVAEWCARRTLPPLLHLLSLADHFETQLL